MRWLCELRFQAPRSANLERLEPPTQADRQHWHRVPPEGADLVLELLAHLDLVAPRVGLVAPVVSVVVDQDEVRVVRVERGALVRVLLVLPVLDKALRAPPARVGIG